MTTLMAPSTASNIARIKSLRNSKVRSEDNLRTEAALVRQTRAEIGTMKLYAAKCAGNSKLSAPAKIVREMESALADALK